MARHGKPQLSNEAFCVGKWIGGRTYPPFKKTEIQKMEKINGNIEKVPVTSWIDKKVLVGKEIVYEIMDVLKLDNDTVLKLGDGKGNQQFFRMTTPMLNSIIDNFGNDVGDWIGRDVRISFSKFEPKDNSKLSAGVTSVFVWPEDEPMI